MTPAELKDLIDRYLENKVTEHEREIVDEWYASYKDGENKLPAQKEALLKDEIYSHVSAKINKPSKMRRLTFLKYAAAVTILLVSVSLLTRKKTNPSLKTDSFTSIKTGAGQVKKLTLPDGSSVWLNAMSHVRISNNYEAAPQRNVYLDEGEAFFEVTKNPQRPFKVITPSITTKVLGTSFNVKAYQHTQIAVVTVRTGRVQVNNTDKKLAVLTPGLQMSYAVKKQEAKISSADAAIARAWVDGRTILNNVTFNELALAIKNIYGVQLVSKNKVTGTYKYNVNINSSRTIDETLRIICSIHQNKYRRDKNEVIIY